MSKLFMHAVAAIVLSMSFSAFADQTMRTDRQNVDSACTSEAQTAGCGKDKVGSGLMKCIHEYKESHRDFKVSEGCHHAMKQIHEDREAGK